MLRGRSTAAAAMAAVRRSQALRGVEAAAVISVRRIHFNPPNLSCDHRQEKGQIDQQNGPFLSLPRSSLAPSWLRVNNHASQHRHQRSFHPARSYLSDWRVAGMGVGGGERGLVSPEPYKEGEDVEVMWAQQWLQAKVVLVTSKTVLVRFKNIEADPTLSPSSSSHSFSSSPNVPEQLWLPHSSKKLRRAVLGSGHWPGETVGRQAVDQYQHLLVYLQRLDDRVRFQGVHVLRWLVGAAAVAGGLLFFFQEDLRSGLGREGAEVTSRSLQDRKVQEAAEGVAKEVALEILRSPAAIQGASKFVQQVLEDETTKQAAGKLIVELYQDPVMLQHTQEWVQVVLARLVRDESVQKDIQLLLGAAFGNLFADPAFQKTAAAFAQDVIQHQNVQDEALELMLSALHQILDDQAVLGHAHTFVAAVLQDGGVRRETANALWGVVATFMSLGYITPGPGRINLDVLSNSHSAAGKEGKGKEDHGTLKPETRNPKPETLDHQPQTLNPKP